jgi:hypothetical protein
MTGLTTLYLLADDCTPLKSWQLTLWCKAHGADEWTVHVMTTGGASVDFSSHFDEAMTPFRLSNAPRRHLTTYRDGQFVKLWSLTSASLAAVQVFLSEGIFTYQSDKDDWLEDLTLYRQGELMLGIVSHEGEGILRVTGEERQVLEQNGFPFRTSGVYVGY